MTRLDPIATTPQRGKLTVPDFLSLAEMGAFENNARTELIEGEIWVVNAIHSRHARAHALLNGEIFATLKTTGSPLLLYTAPSTELSETSLPEPDIALAEPDTAKVVQGSCVRLAVEISDSSLDHDMGRKQRLYAASGIPEYWVADVEAGVLHQMWAPDGDVYAKRRTIPFGEAVTAATIENMTIETAGLL